VDLPSHRSRGMKAICLAAVSVCASGVGLAQGQNSVTAPTTHLPKNTCLLGSDCLGMSKVPVTACQVTGKNAKAKDACAVDGMKLIGKLTV
jgi:hypothetical protein